MRRRMRDTDTEEEMVEAFKVFDRDGDGLIKMPELRLVMKQIGENLSDKECSEIIFNHSDSIAFGIKRG